MKYCNKCGKMCDDSTMFCPYCGNGFNNGKNKSGDIKRFIRVIVIALIAVLVVGFVVYNKIEKHMIEQNKQTAFAKYYRIGEFGDYGLEDCALVELMKQENIDDKTINNYYYGFINKRYKECIPCIYQRIEPFEGDVTIVKLKDKYALMNKKGNIEQLKYSEIYGFTKEGYAMVYQSSYDKGDQSWIIDRQGNELTQAYTWISDPNDESNWHCYNGVCLLEVTRDGKHGFINKSLKEIVPCKYDNLKSYNSEDFEKYGLIKARLNGNYGCLDWNGNVVIQIDYKILDEFDKLGEGFFLAMNNDDLWGVVDYMGNQIIECMYDKYYTGYEGSFKSHPDAVLKMRKGRWAYYYCKGGNMDKLIVLERDACQ